MWLRWKYKNIGALNEAWGNRFWAMVSVVDVNQKLAVRVWCCVQIELIKTIAAGMRRLRQVRGMMMMIMRMITGPLE